MEKKAKLLLFVSSLIILYTEIVGANINFSLTYIPIIIFVLSLIVLNIRLKNSFSSSRTIIATNLFIIIVNFIINSLCYFIFKDIYQIESIRLSTIFPIATLAYNSDKLDLLNLNRDYFIGIAKYFILPLLLVFTLEQAYIYFVSCISQIFSNDTINDILQIIFRVIIADITFVLLTLSLNNEGNSSINSDIFTRNIFISIMIIMLIVLVLKITMIINCIISVDSKVSRLNDVYPASNIVDYNSLNIYIDSPEDNYSENGELNLPYIQSGFNEFYTSNAYNSLYKYVINMSTINSKLTSRRCTINQALNSYNTYTQNEINTWDDIKSNLIFQIICIFIIYLCNFISIIVVYKAKESI